MLSDTPDFFIFRTFLLCDYEGSEKKCVAEELELDPFSTIQYTISGNQLIIEAIDAEQSMVCFGTCCRCPGRNRCESAC